MILVESCEQYLEAKWKIVIKKCMGCSIDGLRGKLFGCF